MFMEWTYLDWAIAAIFALSGIIGLWRGFSREIISLLTWVIAFYVSLTFSGEVSKYIEKAIPNNDARFIAAVILIFAAIILVGCIFNKIIHSILRLTGFGILDRLLGLLFGLARAVVIGTALFLLLVVTNFHNESWVINSQLAPFFQPLVDYYHTHFSFEVQNAHIVLNNAARNLVAFTHATRT